MSLFSCLRRSYDLVFAQRTCLKWLFSFPLTSSSLFLNGFPLVNYSLFPIPFSLPFPVHLLQDKKKRAKRKRQAKLARQSGFRCVIWSKWECETLWKRHLYMFVVVSLTLFLLCGYKKLLVYCTFSEYKWKKNISTSTRHIIVQYNKYKHIKHIMYLPTST